MPVGQLGHRPGDERTEAGRPEPDADRVAPAGEAAQIATARSPVTSASVLVTEALTAGYGQHLAPCRSARPAGPR